MGFLSCEYSLRATQATDSSLKRVALKEDLTEHQPVTGEYQEGWPVYQVAVPREQLVVMTGCSK